MSPPGSPALAWEGQSVEGGPAFLPVAPPTQTAQPPPAPDHAHAPALASWLRVVLVLAGCSSLGTLSFSSLRGVTSPTPAMSRLAPVKGLALCWAASVPRSHLGCSLQ